MLTRVLCKHLALSARRAPAEWPHSQQVFITPTAATNTTENTENTPLRRGAVPSLLSSLPLQLMMTLNYKMSHRFSPTKLLIRSRLMVQNLNIFIVRLHKAVMLMKLLCDLQIHVEIIEINQGSTVKIARLSEVKRRVGQVNLWIAKVIFHAKTAASQIWKFPVFLHLLSY